MKLVLEVFTVTLLIGLSAHAQMTDQPPKPIGQPIQSPRSPPKPIKPGKFSTLKSAWELGTSTSESMLKGDWIMVAYATNKPCGFMPDQQDPDGTRNPDGTRQFSLTFDQFVDNAISGATKFGVKISNAGKDQNDQGPYEVDPLEPQFATYAYVVQPDLSVKLGLSFWSHSCRSVSIEGDRMVCASRLNVAPSEVGEINEKGKQCAASGDGLMLAFKKVK